jgi:hypothetical protein
VFKELQITLYDFFGYLLPGAIVLIALVLLFWSLFWPAAPLTLRSDLPVLAVTGLIFVAYLVGHLGQGIGNFLERLPKVKRNLEANLPLSQELGFMVREAVAARFGEKAKSLTPKELSLLCDQALIFTGSPGDREIFVYREGFYRGTFVALALLTLTLVLRLVCSPAVITFAFTRVEIHRPQLALAAVLVGIGAWLSFLRYLRFGIHKNATCFTRFLALASSAGLKEKDKKSP